MTESVNRMVLPDDRPPFFVSAGLIKSLDAMEYYAESSGVAVQVVGSVSYDEHGGNDPSNTKRVFYYDEITRKAYNAVGLQNPGHRAVDGFIAEGIDRAHDAGQKVLVNLVTLTYEDPIERYPQLAYWVSEKGADGVELNLSCPNHQLKDGLICHNAEATEHILSATRAAVGDDVYLGAKVTELSDDQVEQQATIISKYANFATILNGSHAASPIDVGKGTPVIEVNDGFAGVSGPAITETAREQLDLWFFKTLDMVHPPELWSVGGVASGYEVRYRTEVMGAFAVGSAQALYRAPDPRAVLAQWTEQYDEARISDSS